LQAARDSTAPFEPRQVALRDGRNVRVRALLPGDEEEVLQAFDRLGPEARYTRFMASVKLANEQRLRTVLASFPQGGLAIAATVPADDGIDIVGTASFVIEDARSAEFALAIVDAWCGAGLGRRLLEAIVEAARARGLERLRGFVLASNQPMLALGRRLGFEAHADPDDFTIRVLTLAL
jgi:RimJ/RimL family protein N-acetyltransferase